MIIECNKYVIIEFYHDISEREKIPDTVSIFKVYIIS